MGDLVGLDCFCVGKLNGVGSVWQFTAVDTKRMNSSRIHHLSPRLVIRKA